MKLKARWARCVCGCAPADHQAVVLQPVCIDNGKRVLFEGTLGACGECDCDLYALRKSSAEATR